MKTVVEIVTALESPSTASVIRDETMLEWDRASGLRVWDEAGIEYIDLTAGSGVHNVGHNHPEVLTAIIRQLKAVTHTGWQYPTRSRAQLLECLSEYLPFPDPKFIFTVTGSEAVEAALKVARLAKGRPAILSFQGGFHGKTGGSLAVTANPRLRSGVSNVPPDVLRLPFPEDDALRDGDVNGIPSVREYLAWIERLILHPDFPLNQIAGIIVEPVQGSSGMNAAPPNFLTALRELTSRLDLLLIVDEIFTGMGRTGRFFGFQHEELVPDIVILGKSLGGGLPMSLVAANAELMNCVPAYMQTSTFSGHPVACAAGLAVLDIIKREGLIENAEARGRDLKLSLEELGRTYLSEIGVRLNVTGRGLMLGARFDAETVAKSQDIARLISHRLKEQRVLALLGGTYNNVIKITPPLTLTENDVALICQRFEVAIKAVVNMGVSFASKSKEVM